MENPIFNNIPIIIITPRLRLQLPKVGDGTLVHAAMMDDYKNCVKWLNWSATPPTIEQVEEDCKKQSVGFIASEGVRYLIINNTTDEVMGRAALPAALSNWRVPMCGIAYFMARRFQGKGYTTEAVAAITKMAFEIMKVRKVKITVDPDNVASLKIPQKLGFKLEAKQRGEWFRSDKPLAELHTYAMFDLSELSSMEYIRH